MNSQGGSVGSCMSSRLSTAFSKDDDSAALVADDRPLPASTYDDHDDDMPLADDTADVDDSDNRWRRTTARRRSSGTVRRRARATAGVDSFELMNECAVMIAAVASVLSLVGLVFFRHLFRGVVHLLSTMAVMALVLAGSSTFIAAVAIKLSVKAKVHPDNVTIPIVCAVSRETFALPFIHSFHPLLHTADGHYCQSFFLHSN